MANKHEESESLSLPKKLLRLDEKSSDAVEFRETENQIKALDWVAEIMDKLKENQEKAKSNDK